MRFRFGAYIVVKGSNKTVYKPRDFHKTSHRLLKADIREGIKRCYGAIWYGLYLVPIAEMTPRGTFSKLKTLEIFKKGGIMKL